LRSKAFYRKGRKEIRKGRKENQRPSYNLPGDIWMRRVAFRLRIKADAIEGYEKDHAHVWPELLAKLKEVGISDYSIFRRGQDLVLVMRVRDFDAAWDALATDPVNLRWQAEMAKYFEPVPGLQPGERFAMMKEVFYME
jgi:L-rhamnose mutarotase